MGQDSVLWNNNDPITNIEILAIHVVGLPGRRYCHVITNPGVFVHDSIFDPAIGTNTNAGLPGFFMLGYRFKRFIKITAEKNCSIKYGARPDKTADPDNAVKDDSPVQNAAVRDNGMIDLSAVNFGTG